MARGRIIKQEQESGSTVAESVDVIPCSRSLAVDEAGRALNSSRQPAAMERPATFAPPPESSDRGRGARSGAPSIDTRPPVPMYQEEEDQDEECMLMEVRPRVKVLPEEDNTGNHNVSFMSNPAFQAIGQKLKEVNDTLGTLQSLGIQHVASLPELVLVGDQSAGKSSIMSAIAGLNLPHNTGVCTRCPVHIRSSRAVGPDWTCRITLQQDYSFEPGDQPIGQNDVTRENPFPPWVRQPRVVKEFLTIREKVESIEHVLRWAQVAILNHGRNHELYIPKDRGESEGDEAAALARAESQTQAKFSPNTVALEIRGPDLPDLSFYDLPGVFANARHVEDQYLADVVLNLTREYISHPGAIILWAVPMNTDPENSSTFRVIRDMNAVNRCLGVMTKADLLPRGGHDQWIDILEGKSHQTGLGYFITSRPDKGDLEAQTAWEESFFNRRARHASHTETPTWPEKFADHDEKCGVVRLKDFLSRKLAEDFARSLPTVKSILQHHLQEIVDKLKRLPELPPNPELEIRKGLMEFTALARTCLKGQEFLDVWKVKGNEFSNAILSMKPKYVVKPPVSNVIDLDSDSPSIPPTPGAPSKRQSVSDHYAESQNTPSKRRASGFPASGASGFKIEDGNTPQAFLNGGFRASVTPVATPSGLRPPGFPPRSRSLDELRAIIQSKRQPGMPNSTPDAVYEFLCKESVQPWGRPVSTFLKETTRLVNAEMHKALGIAFSSLKKRSVYREARVHLNAFLKSHHDTLAAQLTLTHNLEREGLFTNNEKFFMMNQEAELRELTRHRHHFRWAAFMGGQGDRPRPAAYDQMTDEEKQQEQARMAKEAPKMGRDPYQQELEVAGYARGYYLTAASRFIDTVSLNMIHGMFPAVANSIPQHLDKKLGLLDQADGAVFNRLMEEEPKTAELRSQLKTDRKKFEKAMESILALEKSAGTARNGGGGDEEMDFDGDILMGPGSPVGESNYPASLATGEVL